MPISVGQLLHNGRYRIDGQLGQGGMGAVYRAWDMNLNIPVAVKENLDTSTEAQKQFGREAHLLARLSHPNLPRVIDHFFIPGQGQYLVMDYVEGEDLQSMLNRLGALPEPQVLAWVGQVCDALGYLHSQPSPVIHRDIKPANIRIRPDGRAMLVDFGIAKVYDAHLATTVGARAVTPGYSPPEQYGGGITDTRSDIYALGATLYHLLTGNPPPESVIRAAANVPVPPPRQVNPQVSPMAEQAILKAIDVATERRFQSVAELRAALTAPASHAGAAPTAVVGTKAASAPPAIAQTKQKKKQRQPWMWLGVLGCSGFLIASLLLGIFIGPRLSASLSGNAPTATFTISAGVPAIQTPVAQSAPQATASQPPTSALLPTDLPAPALELPAATVSASPLPASLTNKYALRFDGVDDFVSVVNPGVLNFAQAFTLEAWVKPEVSPAGDFKAIIQGAMTEPPFSGHGWVLFLDNSDYSNWGLSICTPNCGAAASGVGSLEAGQWWHIASVYDGQKITLYRSGDLLVSVPFSGTPGKANFILFGIWETSFYGWIDEVRIWNIALTQEQVQQGMKRILSGDEAGLVGYWRFEDGYGQIAQDSTPMRNDGRLGSSPDVDNQDPQWEPY